MKIGVVTVTYNSHHVMAEFLHSVFTQTYDDWHLYVYDNDSKHCIKPILAEYDSTRYEFVNLESNYGFAISNNLAIMKALHDGCDAVLIINNDTVFEPDLFVGLVEQMNLQHALVVAPKMLHYPEKDIVWYGGGYFDPLQAQKNIHIGMGDLDDGRFDTSGWVDVAPMCCLLVHNEAFERIGYLDEKYFIYYEDTDWAYRAKLLGIRIWYAAQYKIYHKVSSLTGGTKSRFTVYHATRGKIRFINKFYFGHARYYWLSRYFAGFFVGLVLKRYTWFEFRVKLRAFLSTIKF